MPKRWKSISFLTSLVVPCACKRSQVDIKYYRKKLKTKRRIEKEERERKRQRRCLQFLVGLLGRFTFSQD
jgi:hypothetical protein